MVVYRPLNDQPYAYPSNILRHLVNNRPESQSFFLGCHPGRTRLYSSQLYFLPLFPQTRPHPPARRSRHETCKFKWNAVSASIMDPRVLHIAGGRPLNARRFFCLVSVARTGTSRTVAVWAAKMFRSLFRKWSGPVAPCALNVTSCFAVVLLDLYGISFVHIIVDVCWPIYQKLSAIQGGRVHFFPNYFPPYKQMPAIIVC